MEVTVYGGASALAIEQSDGSWHFLPNKRLYGLQREQNPAKFIAYLGHLATSARVFSTECNRNLACSKVTGFSGP